MFLKGSLKLFLWVMPFLKSMVSFNDQYVFVNNYEYCLLVQAVFKHEIQSVDSCVSQVSSIYEGMRI